MSVKIIVLSSNGELIFESIGGIDFVQKVKETGSTANRSVGLVPKEAKEFSIEDIREGIEIAFHPLIYCEKIGYAKDNS